MRIMDRTEVILDIFARARSAEAKMQAELAQLEYLLPPGSRACGRTCRAFAAASGLGTG